MIKISVIIITKNAATYLDQSLQSVAWADEILVSDSGSSDATIEIAKKHTDKVYNDEWQGFGRQKNLLVDRASNDWILNIDADEILEKECREEFEKRLPDLDVKGYYLRRKNFFFGRFLRYAGEYPDYQLRLFNKNKGRFQEREVHESVKVEGSTERLATGFLHYTYEDVADFITRNERYSTLAAQQMKNEGKRSGNLKPYCKAVATFIRYYIVKRSILDGSAGFIVSKLYANYTYKKYHKLSRLT